MRDIKNLDDLLCCHPLVDEISADARRELLNSMNCAVSGILGGLKMMGDLLEVNTDTSLPGSDVSALGGYIATSANLLSAMRVGIEELTVREGIDKAIQVKDRLE